MNIPYMLGTMFTPNRDRAKVYGALFHFLNGWVFSIVYVAGVPQRAPLHLVVRRACSGSLHGAFVPPSSCPSCPGVHPRMASELRGPTVARQLEPPGFLALNYGVRTPISVLIAHVAFGAMLGGFYAPADPVQGRGASVPALSCAVPFGGTHTPSASTPLLSAAFSSRAKKSNDNLQDNARGSSSSSVLASPNAFPSCAGAGAKPKPHDQSSQPAMLGFTTARPPAATCTMPEPIVLMS